MWPSDDWPCTLPLDHQDRCKKNVDICFKCCTFSCIYSSKINWWLSIQLRIFFGKQKLNGESAKMNNDDICLPLYLLFPICMYLTSYGKYTEELLENGIICQCSVRGISQWTLLLSGLGFWPLPSLCVKYVSALTDPLQEILQSIHDFHGPKSETEWRIGDSGVVAG